MLIKCLSSSEDSFILKKGKIFFITFFLNKGNSGPEKGIIGV